MNINCYIVEDQEDILKLLEEYVRMTEGLVLVGKATDAHRAAEDLLTGGIHADLTFMDIRMPGISGIELAGMVNARTEIIFTTGHREYGPEAFEYHVLDYMVKPISYERFIKGVEKARIVLRNRKHDHPPYIFVPGDGKSTWTKIMYDDIIYIRADSNYMHFVTDQRSLMSYITMEQALKELPEAMFARVHKSFIVNMNRVAQVDVYTVYMDCGKEIPIGRNFKEELMRRIRRV